MECECILKSQNVNFRGSQSEQITKVTLCSKNWNKYIYLDVLFILWIII